MVTNHMHKLVATLDEVLRELRGLRADMHGAKNPSALMTKRDVCALLGCEPRTLQRMIAAGEAPQPTYVRSRPRWKRGQVEAWIAGKKR